MVFELFLFNIEVGCVMYGVWGVWGMAVVRHPVVWLGQGQGRVCLSYEEVKE